MAVLEKEIASGPTEESWPQAVDQLFADMERWTMAWHRARGLTPDWNTRRSGAGHLEALEDDEERLPLLEINVPPRTLLLAPSERLVAEPVTPLAQGQWGRVDFYAWPSLYRVMLLLPPGGGWIVRQESGKAWPHPWGETAFAELAESLLRV